MPTLSEQIAELEAKAASVAKIEAALKAAQDELTKSIQQVTALTGQVSILTNQINALKTENVRLTSSIKGTNYPVRMRGEFAMTVAAGGTAQYPKATKSTAVGGTQTGTDDGAIQRGDTWIVTNCNGRKFSGMPANFTFSSAIITATKDNAGNAFADWKIDAVGVTVTPTNQNPTAAITSPSSGASFTAGTPIEVTITASDPDGTIANSDIKLLINDVDSGLTAASNKFTWAGGAPGTYALKVKVTDNQGGVFTSSAINVTINASTVTRTFVDGVDLGDTADRNWSGQTRKGFTDLVDAPNWTKSTMYTRNQTFIAQSDLSGDAGNPIVNTDHYSAIISAGYNLRGLIRSGLTPGNYELEVTTQHFYDNASLILQVNGTNAPAIQRPATGNYYVKTVIPVTVGSGGTITITDQNTIINPGGQGSGNVAIIDIYKLTP